MYDILHGLIPTRLNIIAPHKPVVAMLAKMLHPCDILSLRAAYEGYTRLFAHGRWRPNMSTQWFHGACKPEHAIIAQLCHCNNRYDLLEKMIGVMPANELFTTDMFAKACTRGDVKSVDICARVLVRYRVVRPYTNKLWHGKVHAYGGESYPGHSTLAIKKRDTLYLHQLTKEMVMLPSVRALLACASSSEIASGMTPSSYLRELDPDVCELLKTIYISMVAAGEYVTASEEDIKKYNQSADGLEEEYLRALLSDFHPRSPKLPEYGSFKFVDDVDDHPIFADVPEDLKTAVYDRNYVGLDIS
jgi:hypothetical protein